MPYLAATHGRPLARLCAGVLLVVAACGSGVDPDARLASRRAALGLGGEPLPFADAMARIQEKAFEGFLARVGSKALAPDAALDGALELEDLLERADPATAAARPPNPPLFDSRMRDARIKARELSRALARGADGKAEAGEVVGACVACHITFRTPR